jgi:rubrerythrin
MMKPSLLKSTGESRHSRRRRSGAASRAPVGPPRTPDPDVRRARAAGGPIDNAAYSCQCGYIFSAAVSTTVSCPHCGTDQAW